MTPRPRFALTPDAATAATVLGAPAPVLLTLGADDRVGPVGGRNQYEQPLSDLAPLVRLSSCTATPPDGLALAVADRWRRAQLAALTATGQAPDPRTLHADVARRIASCLGLPAGSADRMVLSPSGTEVEALATAFAAGDGERPLLNALVGSREAGRGTRLAAEGRWFLPRSAFSDSHRPGEPIGGFDRYRLRVVDVDVRDRAGRPRRRFDVEAEVEAHVEDALEAGGRVLVHVMDASKTGLRHPGLGWVARWRARYPDRLRVLVDAAQVRAPAARLRSYLAAGASVLLTGSKALSGPPFSGALLLDDGLAADAERLAELPDGLAASVAAADLPAPLAALGAGWQPANYGLLARWQVALGEWESLLAVPPARREEVRGALVGTLSLALTALPGVTVLPPPGPEPTIVSFLVRSPDSEPCGAHGLADVYRRLAREGVYVGQPVELAPGGPAVLRVAVGAATVTRLLADGEPPQVAAARTAATLAERLRAALPRTAPA